MHLLAETLIGKDCQIIISSSWRFHHPLEHLQCLFHESLREKVAGVTVDAFVGRWPQHSEILIEVYKHAGRWRALDDSWSSQRTELINDYPTKESTGATPVSVTLSMSAIIVCIFEAAWLTESTGASHLRAALA